MLLYLHIIHILVTKYVRSETSIVDIVAAKEVGDTRLGSGDEISGQC